MNSFRIIKLRVHSQVAVPRRTMVLDIELFRADKGGDPDKIRENQRKRFKDVGYVDRVVEADTKWRKRELIASNAELTMTIMNNLCSKISGGQLE